MITSYQNKAVKRYFLSLKANLNVHGKKPGDEFTIETDSSGIPLEQKWRNRLKDTKMDGCITILKQKSEAKTEKKGRDK